VEMALCRGLGCVGRTTPKYSAISISTRRYARSFHERRVSVRSPMIKAGAALATYRNKTGRSCLAVDFTQNSCEVLTHSLFGGL
ncbi:hypothetical protein N9E07_07170, partial [Planktomarina temperata]|nr:hypothetical protein [Planktomarina temperata]